MALALPVSRHEHARAHAHQNHSGTPSTLKPGTRDFEIHIRLDGAGVFNVPTPLPLFKVGG